MADIQWREPFELAAGDTLIFKRSLRGYSAADGWSLLYAMRGGAQPIEFASTPDTDGASHVITVSAAVTSTWLPADYVLAGFAVKGDERHQIYYGDLKLCDNLPAAEGGAPKKTFAQQMVEQLELVMLAKAGNDLAASQVGESRFQYLTPEQLRTEHAYWVSVRNHEVSMQRAREGRPNRMKTKPMMRVIGQGPSVGMFGRGSGYAGW